MYSRRILLKGFSGYIPLRSLIFLFLATVSIWYGFLTLVNNYNFINKNAYIKTNVEIEDDIKNKIAPMFYKNMAPLNEKETKYTFLVKILCLINTSKKELRNRAIHVNVTWAKRCDKKLFLSYDEEIDLPYLDLNVKDSRYNLWEKIRKMFKWVYKNELNNFDFFLRVDDDAYVIMENLKYMLLQYNPNKALYFGCRFKKLVNSGYMSGGAGYILSREAVRQIVPAFNNPEICPQKNENKEDAKIGACIEKLGITIVDTRDNKGRHRMLPFTPFTHFQGGLDAIHLDYLYYPYRQDQPFEGISDHIISFHYVFKELFYIFEFLIYRVKIIKLSDKALKTQNIHTNSSILNIPIR